jgi:nucleoid-associated protein YgaU
MPTRPFRALVTAWLVLWSMASLSLGATSSQELAALRQKAESGNAIAQHQLGVLHANPQEPAFDLAEAYVWLNLAAEKGARPRELATLTERMSPAQITEGQRRLAARRTSPISPAPIITPAPLAEAQPTNSEELKRLSDELADAWRENQQLRNAMNADGADVRKRLSIAETALANRERELQALRRQVQSATSNEQGAERQAERERLVRETAELRAQVAEAREAASAATERALGHVTQNRQLLATVAELTAARDATASRNNEAQELQRRLDAAEQARRETSQALAAAHTELAQLRTHATQQADTAAQTERLRQELNEAREVLARRTEEIRTERQLREANERTLQETRAAVAAGADRQTQLEQLQRRLTAAEAAQAQATQALTRTQAQLAEARQAASQATTPTTETRRLREDLTALQESLATRERELEAERAARATAERGLADARGAAAQGAASRTATEDEVIQLRGQLATARTELEAVRRQVDLQRTAANDVTRLQQQLAALETERNDLRGQVEQSQAAGSAGSQTRDEQLAQVESRLSQSLRAFALQESELTRVRRQLEETTARAESTAAELSGLRPVLTQAEQGAAETNRARQEIARLRAELESITRTAQTRAEELAAAQALVANAERDVSAATQEATVLRQQMRQTQAQSAATAMEAAELRTRLALAAPAPGTGRSSPSRPGAPIAVPSAGSPAAPPPAAAAVVESPATTANANSIADQRVHVVAPGDSLSRIARQYYGDANRWPDILEANRDVIRTPEALRVGQELRIP